MVLVVYNEQDNLTHLYQINVCLISIGIVIIKNYAIYCPIYDHKIH